MLFQARRTRSLSTPGADSQVNGVVLAHGTLPPPVYLKHDTSGATGK
jgi:hypothetical protein